MRRTRVGSENDVEALVCYTAALSYGKDVEHASAGIERLEAKFHLSKVASVPRSKTLMQGTGPNVEDFRDSEVMEAVVELLRSGQTQVAAQLLSKAMDKLNPHTLAKIGSLLAQCGERTAGEVQKMLWICALFHTTY